MYETGASLPIEPFATAGVQSIQFVIKLNPKPLQAITDAYQKLATDESG